MSDTAIVIPTLNEEAAIPQLAADIAALDPRPADIVLVDGGSTDRTVVLAEAQGWRVVHCEKGRARQINAGVEAARAGHVVILHADTRPPADMVAVIERTLTDRRIALAGFTPIIAGTDKVRWGTTAHNWLKTWYAPLLTRPHLFVRGVRLLCGDHAMFFRRADFLAVGGCTPGDTVMEEADLCVKFATLGRIRMVRRIVRTSDRRIAAWGPLKANWIYFKVGMLWAFGLRSRMARHYPDIR